MKTPEELIDQGNELRAAQLPEQALECYAQAFTKNRRQAAAFNNYGNVLRELGDPAGAIPFLQRAVTLHPEYVTAKFNLAVVICCWVTTNKVGHCTKLDGTMNT
jgi:tetratricopeptide (TPR) repeat protein